jgi:intracellular sulfur oxidation DsrE/DsrF family protein
MDDIAHDAPSRSAFLTAGAAGAALLATAVQPANAASDSASSAAIEAVLHRPARHKQVIAAPRIAGGQALRYAGNGLNAFQFAFGEGAGSMHIACVFYGPSLLFVANDALWGRYALFDVLDRANDALPTFVHTPQNPFLHARSSLRASDARDDMHGFYHDFTVEALSRRGVTWMVCNNALQELTREIAAAQKTAPETVYADFRRNFVPGALVVPAGVAAIVLAQEAGFTFLSG